MALEELGGWQDLRAQDGPRPGSRFPCCVFHICHFGFVMKYKCKPRSGHHHRVREEAEEEVADRLSLRKPQESQLLGVQIFLLRVPRDPQCCRWVLRRVTL